MHDQTLRRMLTVTATAHLLFAVWPSIDIAVSRYFFLLDGTFWLSSNSLAEQVRIPIWLASVALAILSALMLCASLFRGKCARTPWRFWAFVTATYLLGPGVLVNVILKQNWGRARPVTILEFGGDKLYTPPFEFAGQCVKNCSFVSGEAASAAVMGIVLGLCVGRGAPTKWRFAVYAGLGAMVVLASGLRIATGRHFLSDVVFAALFMLIVARLCFRGLDARVPGSKGFVADILVDLFGWTGFRGKPAVGVIVTDRAGGGAAV